MSEMLSSEPLVGACGNPGEEDLDKDFEAIFASTSTFSELAELYRKHNWDDPSNTQGQRIFDKAFNLIETSEQAMTLSTCTDSGSNKRKVLYDKALELAQAESDLDTIFDFLQDNPTCFQYRNVLRKVFDKADELGMSKLY